MAEVVKLAEDRVESFDHDATAVHTIAPAVDVIRRFVSAHRNLKLLDVGGGNGTFLDAMLKALPQATGTIVEMSKGMAEKNAMSDRKAIVCEDFLDWAVVAEKSAVQYDVVFFNFVLHHFVGKDRKQSMLLQQKALHAARELLAEDGLIVVYEIHYNGFLHDELPSSLIHTLSSSRTLAPLTKLFGANTAGYGVCFHSEVYWEKLFRCLGLRVAHGHVIEHGVFSGIRHRFLQIVLNIASMNYKIQFLQRENLS
jgi:2-polyprenyl-3-methyl-5-hydroxy-6-metoxy-1,4-benzoquinol methylase